MLKDILKTLFIGMLPVLEIRGAIPVGVAAGLDPWSAFFIGFVGNMLPVPFLILLTRKIIEWMKKHHILDKLTSFLERKGSQKAQTVQKYSFWGLFILVAIPLPGTGAWTGALVFAFGYAPEKGAARHCDGRHRRGAYRASCDLRRRIRRLARRINIQIWMDKTNLINMQKCREICSLTAFLFAKTAIY